MVASTIILIVFAIVTMSLHTLLANRVTNDTSLIEYKLRKLIYQNSFEKIKSPISIDEGKWTIHISNEPQKNVPLTVFEAIDSSSKKKIHKQIIAYEN